MSDMVLVALDREKAEWLAFDASVNGNVEAARIVDAALAADPSVLEEQIARAIAGVTFKPGTVDRFFSDPTMSVVKDQALAQARAVVRVLTNQDGDEAT